VSRGLGDQQQRLRATVAGFVYMCEPLREKEGAQAASGGNRWEWPWALISPRCSHNGRVGGGKPVVAVRMQGAHFHCFLGEDAADAKAYLVQ